MTQKVVTNNEAITGSNQMFYLPIFGIFERWVTNIRGTFVENVKNSQKSTHPLG
jgi:hypothetical protein